MSKSISITNPDKIVSLVLEPRGDGAKIGGKLDLSIFTNVTRIDVSDLEISELGELPSKLINFNGSGNKLTNIPSTFSVPNSLTNFNLNKNNLTTTDIEHILLAFDTAYGDVSAISPKPIIDISQFGNAVPNAAGLAYIATLETNGWNVKYNPGEYVLFTDTLNLSEAGPDIVINISRTISDIPDGTTVDYEVSGIQQDDVAQPLTGSFTMNDNVGSATFSIAKDFGTDKYLEGESFIMTLLAPHEVTSISIPIVDTTPAPYQLTAVNSLSEGEGSFTITLTHTSIPVEHQGSTTLPPAGTQVPYAITGIQEEDIAEDLTGFFTLDANQTATITITPLVDSNINEVETMVITLDAPFTAVSKEIRIFDQ